MKFGNDKNDKMFLDMIF